MRQLKAGEPTSRSPGFASLFTFMFALNARSGAEGLYPSESAKRLFSNFLSITSLQHGQKDDAVKAMRESPAIARADGTWNRFFKETESIFSESQTEMRVFFDELSSDVYDVQFQTSLAEFYFRAGEEERASRHCQSMQSERTVGFCHHFIRRASGRY